MLNHTIIDLVAEATWVALLVGSAADAAAYASAANVWVAANPFQLSQCPFEEHVPPKAFCLNFEAGEYDERWACYCHCSWVLKHHFASVADAAKEGEKYFDLDGVSPIFLEEILFGDENCDEDELPDGRPLYVYDPELKIYSAHQHNVDEYILRGGYGRIVIEKIDGSAASPAAH